jgi:riboflavin synthase
VIELAGRAESRRAFLFRKKFCVMFTGLVEATGEVLTLDRNERGARLVVAAPEITHDLKTGDSVAVNGCCLTAVEQTGKCVAFDLLEETLQRTNLGGLAPGALVNLERALAAGARLGGHFVQGHVDCAAPVRAFETAGPDHRLEIALPGGFARYAVFKGSIAVNGVSLTVAEAREESFVVWIIPHTFAMTNLRELKSGGLVNLEFDLLAKYVERILQK